MPGHGVVTSQPADTIGSRTPGQTKASRVAGVGLAAVVIGLGLALATLLVAAPGKPLSEPSAAEVLSVLHMTGLILAAIGGVTLLAGAVWWLVSAIRSHVARSSQLSDPVPRS